ncbi:N-acetyltransferase family protein [Nocardia sp. 004]|uniref:GNAT family N-acetyltransferase n=1 Tax=Nocardia sp. 004 TaxID=3385978 RepID=UPI00399FC2AA
MTPPLLRLATRADEPFLLAMLYEASYAAEQGLTSPEALRSRPDLSCYIDGWGTGDDFGIIGSTATAPQGATWIRLLTSERPGYGYIDDNTPELVIAVVPDARGTGLGTALLTRLIADVRSRYPAISLSVRLENPARRLYTRLGFTDVVGSEITNRAGTTSMAMILRF